MITQEQSNAVRTAGRGKGWPALLIAFIIPFAAAAIGSAATNPSRFGWYRQLRKPSWNPPAWVFGPRIWQLNRRHLNDSVSFWLLTRFYNQIRAYRKG